MSGEEQNGTVSIGETGQASKQSRVSASLFALAERLSTFENKCPQALCENYLKYHDTCTGRGFDLAHVGYILFVCNDVIAKHLAETEYGEEAIEWEEYERRLKDAK